jgi:uncharacterized protein involved in outer membrane biogenesis
MWSVEGRVVRSRAGAILWRASWALLSGGLLLVVGCEAVGWRFLRPALEHQLGAAAGVSVVIGEPFRARLLGPPELTAQRLTVGVAAGVPAPHLLDADRVRLSWRWSDVWAAVRGEALRMRELEMASLDLHLVRDTQGHASWQLGDVPAGHAWAPPVIERLAVHGGSVNVDDQPRALRMKAPIEPLGPRDEVPETRPRLMLTLATTASAAHDAP